ncbi:glutathione S-transferase family protein [Pendulispora brunnea]|uniref:Glutathione S-transferase family protein n=1 Tax=Pendulispora brunnea TaxID=2905690 RepID=A0ABZ2K0A4_9BACT
MTANDTSGLTLYELAGADPELRFSPFCWKVRMALVHKGLEVEHVPVRFAEKETIAFSGQRLVPVLRDGEQVVTDSWRIALHLEERFPDRPSLFSDPATIPLTQFVNAWTDSVLPYLLRVILLDVYNSIHESDREYFRSSREKRFGMRLEAFVADKDANLAHFQKALNPLRTILTDRDFVAGDAPAYADYCAFSMFMWARGVSQTELLPPDDPIFAWREHLLNAFDGFARKAPRRR